MININFIFSSLYKDIFNLGDLFVRDLHMSSANINNSVHHSQMITRETCTTALWNILASLRLIVNFFLLPMNDVNFVTLTSDSSLLLSHAIIPDVPSYSPVKHCKFAELS